MCGIFGWYCTDNALSPKQKLALSSALCVLNDTRGGDSWGWHSVMRDKTRHGLGPIASEAFAIAKAKVMFAHTRYATVGKVTIANAHPFRIGGIIGAHNGCVWNHYALDKKYKRKTTVDSQHIFLNIAEGISQGEIEGYGSIEYTDQSIPDTVYLATSGGELAVYGVGKRSAPRAIVWSSNGTHLLAALRAAGAQAFPYEIEDSKLYSVERTGEAVFLYRVGTFAFTVQKYPAGETSTKQDWGALASYWERKSTNDLILDELDEEEEEIIDGGELGTDNTVCELCHAVAPLAVCSDRQGDLWNVCADCERHYGLFVSN